MKVKELISKLKELDPELEVLGYTEDEALLSAGHLFRLMALDGVSVTEGEQQCGDDRVPTLKLGKSAHSVKLVTIDLVSDF